MNKEIKNSIWPNGIGVDQDGYAVFYPMGTNKVEIPKNSPHWPKGSKLVSSFVYDKNNNLVGFCDTKAMTSTNNGEIIVMPYEEIDTDFDSIENGTIQIHAPKAVVKKASWTGSTKKDIADVDYKYKGCLNMTQLRQVDEKYLENDIVDGKWTELLSDMDDTGLMFNECNNLISFTSDLSSIRTCYNMFQKCSNLTSFEADLSSLRDGRYMFDGCENLSDIDVFNLRSLYEGGAMFKNCHNLSKFDCDLISLENGSYMFFGCSKISSFSSNLDNLSVGEYMFKNCNELSDFSSDLKSLTKGAEMFQNCINLSTFKSDLSSLIEGRLMFYNCTNLSTFTSDLSSLTQGNSMFNSCSNLISFDSDLSSLKNGYNMFRACPKLASFNSDMNSLYSGEYMFYNCTNLESFTSDINSLSIAPYTFGGCKKLTKFSSNLISLTNGGGMFYGCKLDSPSIKNIIETINAVESGEIMIGIGCDNNAVDKDLFSQEVGYSDMTSLLTALQNKGWTVAAQYNGRPSTTFSLRKPDSLPVYVKLVEVIPSEEDYTHYEYTSQDGSKFYNLDWFHETTGSTDGYDVFSSLEEAITRFNIKSIEK